MHDQMMGQRDVDCHKPGMRLAVGKLHSSINWRPNLSSASSGACNKNELYIEPQEFGSQLPHNGDMFWYSYYSSVTRMLQPSSRSRAVRRRAGELASAGFTVHEESTSMETCDPISVLNILLVAKSHHTGCGSQRPKSKPPSPSLSRPTPDLQVRKVIRILSSPADHLTSPQEPNIQQPTQSQYRTLLIPFQELHAGHEGALHDTTGLSCLDRAAATICLSRNHWYTPRARIPISSTITTMAMTTAAQFS